MSKRKKRKFVLPVLFALGLITMIGKNGNDVDTESDIEDVSQSEQTEETQEVKTDAYGWSVNDYEEFSVALKMIAGNYLTRYNLPSYDKWQFAKFDDEGRIFAITEELTFKDNHEKHLIICVFSLSGNIGENGLHEKVVCHFFGTDEKTYYDDGSCDEVFEKLN